MGLFGLFKSRYNKLKRADVVDAIVKLQEEEAKLEERIMEASAEIKQLTQKGKEEKDHDVRVFLAKKINRIKEERQDNIKRATFIAYNVKLMNKLKSAIDDKEFFDAKSSVPLNQLLADQKGLARFLNQALGTRVKAEQVLTDADDTFVEIMESYDENERIYGVSDSDDELLAVFETADMLGSADGESADKSADVSGAESDGGQIG